ncbi:hypothetical protein, partial [Rhodopseudomonas palustris]|uniref:hypothetical protein n=1 Tax=Rhodopseudomonas palustris TaxID=1076 RepID=UPI001A9FAADD
MTAPIGSPFDKTKRTGIVSLWRPSASWLARWLLKNGNTIIGFPEEAKYGLTREQVFEAFRICKAKGVKRFGLHTMVISNELNPDSFVGTANMMFD